MISASWRLLPLLHLPRAGLIARESPHADCPGAATFLEALPKFANPLPPTPMADIVAELDADYYGLVTKLMSAVNKTGSPCKVRTHACMHASGICMPIRMHAPLLFLCPSLGLLADWQKSITGLLHIYDACMQRSSRHESRAQQHLSECSAGVPGGRSCGACTASQVPALASVHQRS